MAILISTPQDLDNIKNNLSGEYELANDIDLSSWGDWTPINNFAGVIDGKGYVIKNMTIVNTTASGFIGYTSSTFTVKNLGFNNIDITTTSYNAGALVGFTSGTNTKIENCFVEGGTINANGYAGGLIGHLRGTATVKNCYAILDNIYTNKYRSCGFFGAIVGNTHLIENCYAVTKSLDSTDKTEIYGFAYSTANPIVNNCYWDMQISGVINSLSGIGLTTDEMKQQSTYVGWDFKNVWYMDKYPRLRVFGVPDVLPKQETITVNTYSLPIKSNVTKNKKSTISTQSILSPVNAYIKRETRTTRDIRTYTLPINTSVKKYNRTVRNSTQNVYTYINPIHSKIERHIKSQKVIQAHTSPITSYINVLAPFNTFIPNVYLNVIEGNSRAYSMQNMTKLSYITNPTKLEVMK